MVEKINNKIITISGEPASGKSTVVCKLTEKYKDDGYNVHIISIGALFREISVQEYSKMYPRNSNINLSDIQADENFRKKVSQIDKLVDHEVEKRGKEINSKKMPNDVYIVDSRLAWKNIPDSFSVRLTVDDIIAGKRVFSDTSRGKEDHYELLAQAIEKTRERKKSEILRYKTKYNVDITNPENYDLIMDTSFTSIDDLADVIIEGEKAYNSQENSTYPKNWASPACFLPLQLGRFTGGYSCSGNTIESLTENIKVNGYDPLSGTVEIVERNGIKYLLEGNHRTFAALSAGKSILPYITTHKDDRYAKVLANPSLIESKRYEEYLYDYSDGIRYYGGKIGGIKQFESFEVNDLIYYNTIIKLIDEKEK